MQLRIVVILSSSFDAQLFAIEDKDKYRRQNNYIQDSKHNIDVLHAYSLDPWSYCKNENSADDIANHR